jgi:hypothetical protein
MAPPSSSRPLSALLLLLLLALSPLQALAAGPCANFDLNVDNCQLDDNCLRISCELDLAVLGQLSISAAVGLCGAEPVVKIEAQAIGLTLSRTLTQDDIVPIPGFNIDIAAGISAEVGIAIPTLVLNAGPGGNQLGFDMAVEACGEVPLGGRQCRELFDLGTLVLPITRPDVTCSGNSPFSQEVSGSVGGGGGGEDTGMSAGATAGIVIGVLLGLILVVILVLVALRWRGSGGRSRHSRRSAATAPKKMGRGRKPGTYDLGKLEERAFGKKTPAAANTLAAVEIAADEVPVAAAPASALKPAPAPKPKAAPGRKPPPRPAPRPGPRPTVASGWLETVAANKNTSEA